ncbi:hypothetical protein DL93DRAFT_1319447 [Clavulina sp. PMI_390]|nr:hypothetical protein DL93DRAFT_1319447 [Clavulina sp. PMI_390]
MAAHRSAAAAKSGLNPAVSPPADGSAMGFPLSAGAATESGAKDGTFLPVPLSRASSTTSRSTTTGLDDADPSASASEVDAGPGGSVVSQSTRHEEDDDYDDDEYDDIEDDDYDEEEAVENELVGGLAVGGRVGGPPSPAATLRPSHSPSTFRALDPASTSKSSSSPSPSPSPQKSKSRLHPLPQSHPYTSAKSKAAKSSADGEKALTRRERKKLGLPKPKKAFTPSSAPVSSASTSTTASGTRGPRRVILKVNGQRPGSIRHPDELAAEGAGGEAGGEWAKNGSGRMDVRGFKELKI